MFTEVPGELVELADKIAKYGIARSRSHAFSIIVEKGLSEVVKEVGFWDEVYRIVGEMEKKGFKLKHGSLSQILLEERTR